VDDKDISDIGRLWATTWTAGPQ